MGDFNAITWQCGKRFLLVLQRKGKCCRRRICNFLSTDALNEKAKHGCVKGLTLKKRYIKDYVPTAEGEIQYCGNYYLSHIPEEERKKEGKRQVLCSAGSLFLLLTALCIPCQGTQTIYVVIPVEITLICLWIQLSGSYKLMKSEERLEQKDYDKVYQSPIQALTVAIFLYVFGLIGQGICMLKNEIHRSSGDIFFTIILVLVLIISCAAWNRRRKLMPLVTEEKKTGKAENKKHLKK